jgi:hypothetical protein
VEPFQASTQTGLTGGIAGLSGRELIAVGTATTSDPTLLPAGLFASFVGTPSPQLVTLSGATFDRYLNVAVRGYDGSESVYAVPTANGTVLAICRTPAPNPRFASTCQQVVQSIRLSSGTLAPGLLPSYASTLGEIISRLDAARSSWGPRLSASRAARVLVSAANQLAAAQAKAAVAVAALRPGPARSVNRVLATALRTDAQAYGALARAVDQRRVSAYRSAGTAVTRADRAVNSALAALGAFGYRVG